MSNLFYLFVWVTLCRKSSDKTIYSWMTIRSSNSNSLAWAPQQWVSRWVCLGEMCSWFCFALPCCVPMFDKHDLDKVFFDDLRVAEKEDLHLVLFSSDKFQLGCWSSSDTRQAKTGWTQVVPPCLQHRTSSNISWRRPWIPSFHNLWPLRSGSSRLRSCRQTSTLKTVDVLKRSDQTMTIHDVCDFPWIAT